MFITHLQVMPHDRQASRSFSHELNQQQFEATKYWLNSTLKDISQTQADQKEITVAVPAMFGLDYFSVSFGMQFGILVCRLISPDGTQISSIGISRKSKHRNNVLAVLSAKFDVNLSAVDGPPAPWLGRIWHQKIEGELRERVLQFEAYLAWAWFERKS